jgi:NADPH:quinone reductase-like Zn-dependent oxidoreductase
MKIMLLESVGSLSDLKLVERPEPRPGSGEVLVRLRAASLNYRDLVTTAGGYGSHQRQKDLIPLSDGAGEIVDVGAGVTAWKTGDRVAGHIFPKWLSGPPTEARLSASLGGSVNGVACEYRVFGENEILPVPEHLSFEEAAALPCAALTAWVSVIAQGQAGPGQTVLTQGTGGVSLFALQFAKMAGATVVATSSSAEKLARLRQLGADYVINYKDDPDWGRTALKFVPEGADLVVDIGGGLTISQSLRALRMGGTISVIGVVAGPRHDLNVPVLILKNARLQGASAGNRDQFSTMLAAIGQHGLRPILDRTFQLNDLRAALEHLKSGRHVGKVCIAI